MSLPLVLPTNISNIYGYLYSNKYFYLVPINKIVLININTTEISISSVTGLDITYKFDKSILFKLSKLPPNTYYGNLIDNNVHSSFVVDTITFTNGKLSYYDPTIKIFDYKNPLLTYKQRISQLQLFQNLLDGSVISISDAFNIVLSNSYSRLQLWNQIIFYTKTNFRSFLYPANIKQESELIIEIPNNIHISTFKVIAKSYIDKPVITCKNDKQQLLISTGVSKDDYLSIRVNDYIRVATFGFQTGVYIEKIE